MTKPTKRPVRPAKTQISLGIWADVQADLSLRWALMSFCWFCRAAAQIPFQGPVAYSAIFAIL